MWRGQASFAVQLVRYHPYLHMYSDKHERQKEEPAAVESPLRRFGPLGFVVMVLYNAVVYGTRIENIEV